MGQGRDRIRDPNIWPVTIYLSSQAAYAAVRSKAVILLLFIGRLPLYVGVRAGSLFCGVVFILCILHANRLSLPVWYNTLGTVHCIYLGESGYMRHFIWVFTVRNSSRFSVSRIQRVNGLSSSAIIFFRKSS